MLRKRLAVVKGGLAAVVVLPVSSMDVTAGQLRQQERSQFGRVGSLTLLWWKCLLATGVTVQYIAHNLRGNTFRR